VGIAPKIRDAEQLTLAVMQALLHQRNPMAALCPAHLLSMFPDLPGQSGYNERLRKRADTVTWPNSAWPHRPAWPATTVWVADSTPVECARVTRNRE
jgi:hypothetical protein